MKKVILSVLLSTIILAVSVTYLAFANQEIKEKITIDVIKKNKGAVEFVHKKHFEEFKVECIKCHHTEKSNDDIHKGCPECHKPDTENNIPGVGIVPPIKKDPEGKKNIYHDLCKGCHKQSCKCGTKCKECHGGGEE